MNDHRIGRLLELGSWDSATSAERLESARAVAEALPGTFALDRLAIQALGDQSHEIAFFRHGEATFALVPGRRNAILGYDRSRPFRPTDPQREEWRQIQEEEGWGTIEEYLDQCLGPLRHATIAPLLIETVARGFRYRQAGDNQAEGYARVREFCGPGFRLLTPDEWEYACAGGTRTLFRWGDECPATNSCDDGEFTGHSLPNAFGLTMTFSTYDSEICEGPTMRGGDGGSAVCGGIGNVVTWFPLASSFQVPEDEIRGWWIDDVFVRRVRPVLAEDMG